MTAPGDSLANIRMQHVRLRDRCGYCRHLWPCDTAVVLAALDEGVSNPPHNFERSFDDRG